MVVELVLKQQHVVEEHDLFSRLKLLNVDSLRRLRHLADELTDFNKTREEDVALFKEKQ